MKALICLVSVLLIYGCGLETAGTAATTAKLQADQAKQAKENMDNLKASLDASMRGAEQNAKKADEPESK